MTTSTGIPAQSDRSAWDADNYPEKHATDLYNSVPKHHLPLGSDVGNYPRWDGSKWVAQALTVSDLALTDGHIFVGNSSNQAADVALSGDGTIDDTGLLTIQKASTYFALTGSISPASLSGDQDNYNPTNLAASSVLILTSSVDVNITGLQAPSQADLLIIFNNNAAGGKVITLKVESASSSIANRFTGSADAILNPQASILLRYSMSASRWAIIGAGSSGGGGHVIQDEGTPLTQRANLNFVGAVVTATDDAVNNATVITIDGITNPMTTQDDLILGDTGGTPARLAKGTDGQVLTVNSTTHHVSWENSSAAAANAQFIFYEPGNLTVRTGNFRIYNNLGRTVTISMVMIAVNTAPATQAIIVDVNLDGTTIFTNQTHRPQIAAAANTGNTTTIDVASLADGHYLSMDIDQIGTGTVGADLSVHIVYS